MQENSRDVLEDRLVSEIVLKLRKGINDNGQASLGVSGGSTPVNLFKKLSKTEIQWNKIFIFPVDDRVLPDNHPDQNGTLIKQNLLINKAKHATFIPLIHFSDDSKINLLKAQTILDSIDRPFDVLILGMGTDGHTASLFPNSEGIKNGMDINNNELLVEIKPTLAPYTRISLTRSTIEQSKNIYLHIYGNEKKMVYDKAKSSDNHELYPISAFMNMPNFNLYWTE